MFFCHFVSFVVVVVCVFVCVCRLRPVTFSGNVYCVWFRKVIVACLGFRWLTISHPRYHTTVIKQDQKNPRWTQSMAACIDLDTLTERISTDKSTLDNIDGKKLILFIGMTISYLRGLVFK
jgi:hypothetical protein